jgi:hypothetical protein
MSVPAAWIVGLMVALQPSAPWRPTYEKTAEAIARVASSEPLFEGEDGEARTAALLVSIAWYESHLKPDARSKAGNGRWVCLYQIHKRHLADPKKALTDPEVCTREAVKLLRASLAACAKRPKNERLAFFVSGACDKGLPSSRLRMFLAAKLMKDHPLPPPEAKEPPPPPASPPAPPPGPAKTASR